MQTTSAHSSRGIWELPVQQGYHGDISAPHATRCPLRSPLALFLRGRGYETFRKRDASSLRRFVVVAGRRSREDRASTSSSSSSSRRRPASAAAAPTDAAGLLQALIQLASSTTIVVGGHQAYVSARWCIKHCKRSACTVCQQSHCSSSEHS
jgi:hypothetical protein